MLMFIGIITFVFFVFGKNVVITYNAVNTAFNPDARVLSTTYFSLFLIFCIVAWVMMKIAYKQIAFACMLFTMLFLSKKYHNAVKQKAEKEKANNAA